jgi:hypothetical protein
MGDDCWRFRDGVAGLCDVLPLICDGGFCSVRQSINDDLFPVPIDTVRRVQSKTLDPWSFTLENLMLNARTSILRACLLVVAASTMLSAGIGPLPAAEGPAKPAELKVLEKLIGDWTSETTVTVLDGKPQNTKSTGTLTRKWALGGRVVEESGKGSNGEETKVIFAYDAGQHAYRFVYFDSAGFIVDGSGPWDEGAQTFSLKADLGNGVTQTSTMHFTGGDAQEWSSKVTDSAGKVWFEGSGLLKRTK